MTHDAPQGLVIYAYGKLNGKLKRIDKEIGIGIMSARSAQRTRWRRWRMGRDIAGRKDRDGRMSGSQAQLVGGDHALRIGGQLLLLLLYKLIHHHNNNSFHFCCLLVDRKAVVVHKL